MNINQAKEKTIRNFNNLNERKIDLEIRTINEDIETSQDISDVDFSINNLNEDYSVLYSDPSEKAARIINGSYSNNFLSYCIQDNSSIQNPSFNLEKSNTNKNLLQEIQNLNNKLSKIQEISDESEDFKLIKPEQNLTTQQPTPEQNNISLNEELSYSIEFSIEDFDKQISKEIEKLLSD